MLFGAGYICAHICGNLDSLQQVFKIGLSQILTWLLLSFWEKPKLDAKSIARHLSPAHVLPAWQGFAFSAFPAALTWLYAAKFLLSCGWLWDKTALFCVYVAWFRKKIKKIRLPRLQSCEEEIVNRRTAFYPCINSLK